MKTSSRANPNNVRQGIPGTTAWFAHEDHAPLSRKARFMHWILLALLILLTLGLRVIPSQPLLNAAGEGNGAVFRDPDSYYHMRRAEWIAHDYPSVPYEDPYLYYPDKGVIPWVPGYDFVIATVLKMGHLVGHETLELERVVAWINPILATLTALLVFGAGSRLFGRVAGYLAVLLLALSPPHIHYSEIANLDHHAVIALFFALFLYLTIRTFCPGDRPVWRWWLGIAIGVAHWFHPGFTSASLIFIGLLLAVFVVQTWLCRSQDPALLMRFRDIFLAATLATFAASLSTPQGRSLTMVFWILSLFHVLLLMAGWILATAMLLTRPAYPRRRALLALSVLVPVAAVAAFQGNLVGALATGMEYTSGGYWFIRMQSESQSLARLPLRTMLSWYTPLAPLAPVFVVHLLVCGLQRFDRAPQMLLIALFGGVVLVTGWAQLVFGPNAAVFVSLFLAAAVTGLSRRLVEFLGTRFAWFREQPHTALLTIVAMAAQLVVLLPVRELQTKWRTPAVVTVAYARDATARFLRDHTPTTTGRFGSQGRLEYSVFAHRDLGHHINYRSRRPAVINPFGVPPEVIGHTRDFARVMLATSPASARTILDHYRARYFVNASVSAGEFDYYADMLDTSIDVILAFAPDVEAPSRADLFVNRLLGPAGSAIGTGRQLRPAISFLRLRYDFGITKDPDDQIVPRFRVYERVPGAIVIGPAAPGSRVGLSLWLQTSADRLIQYVDEGIADDTGVFRIHVPYPTTATPDVWPLSHYLVQTTAGTFGVDVSEEAVEGAIEVPVIPENLP